MIAGFSELKKNLKKDFSGMPEIRMAVLADSASQLFSQAIKGYGFTKQLQINVWEAEYDRIYESVMDESSNLYSFKPEFVVIFQSSRKLLSRFNKKNEDGKRNFAANQLEQFEQLNATINSRLTCKIIYLNFAEINDQVFGNFGNKTVHSFIYQLRKINFELMQLSAQTANMNIADLSTLQNQYGQAVLTSDRLYINADNVLNIDALGYVAKMITDIILAYTGKFKKCLILDLDNTLWGGIIGDDGIENIQIGDLGIGKAFTEFQLWIKQLQQRGIILTVCSKNTEHIAKEPFEKHPDMILRTDDIAVFVANWENKVNNIRQIQSILNIGFDAMVFLDDNPAEREIVRMNIPEICVPELPEDPAEYLSFLYNEQLFETVSFTEEDKKRTKQYQEEAQRNKIQASYVNEEEFLQSLQMKAGIKPIDKFTVPRAAQLSQRSNQFNLRTIRYNEEDIKAIIADDTKYTFTVSLNDKFGDYGLISLLIAEKRENDKLFIDTWIMSCRVLKRGVENLVLNHLVKLALEKGFTSIVGEYLPTAKNGLVKDHYKNLGFVQAASQWHLDVKEYAAKIIFIESL